jgi:hypothetical protein
VRYAGFAFQNVTALDSGEFVRDGFIDPFAKSDDMALAVVAKIQPPGLTSYVNAVVSPGQSHRLL